MMWAVCALVTNSKWQEREEKGQKRVWGQALAASPRHAANAGCGPGLAFHRRLVGDGGCHGQQHCAAA